MRKTNVTIEFVHDDLDAATEFYLDEISPLVRKNREKILSIRVGIEPVEPVTETVQ